MFVCVCVCICVCVSCVCANADAGVNEQICPYVCMVPRMFHGCVCARNIPMFVRAQHTHVCVHATYKCVCARNISIHSCIKEEIRRCIHLCITSTRECVCSAGRGERVMGGVSLLVSFMRSHSASSMCTQCANTLFGPVSPCCKWKQTQTYTDTDIHDPKHIASELMYACAFRILCICVSVCMS